MIHLNLIRDLAWSYQKSTGIEWEELFGEACLGYAKALASYDSDNGTKITTWATFIMERHLNTYLKQKRGLFESIGGGVELRH